MKIFFDTEFYENGQTIELISIGLVREDGAEYYAETPTSKYLCYQDPWLINNVLPYLKGEIVPRSTIRSDILKFVGEKPQFWAYYADRDWVALCQLYGRMIDLPKGWPMFCMDLKQLAVMKGDPELPKMHENEHHALHDARWNKTVWEFLDAIKI